MRNRTIFLYTIIILLISFFTVYSETIRIVLPINSTQERYAFKAISEYFTNANQGYKIDYYAYEPQTYTNKLTQILNGKESADIILLRAGQPVRDLAGKKLIAPISDIWDKSQNGYTKAQQSLVSHKGVVYAAPFSIYTYGLFYNKNLFLKYGMEPPKSWEDFITIANKLKRYGYYPLSMSGQEGESLTDWFTYLNIKINGLAFNESLMAGNASFLDIRVQKTLEVLKSLKEKDYILPHFEKMTEKEAAAYLLRERTGMMLMRNSYASAIPPMIRQSIEFAPFPYLNEKYRHDEGVYINTFAISAASQNQDAAKKFISFILRSDTQSMLNKLMLSIPANNESISEENCRFVQSGNIILQNTPRISYFSAKDAVWDTKRNFNSVLNRLFGFDDVETVQHLLESMRLERVMK